MSTQQADANLIAGWRGAIDAWEEHATGSTSSITGGGAIRVLEDTFSATVGQRRCLALGSGTAALAACLIGVGVRPGDQVITAALDWSAATEAIRWIGAVPRYADIDPTTATISPAAVRSVWEPTVVAAVATDLFGTPADVPAVRAALPPGTPIVEDCAQTLGGRLDGHPVGTLADAAAFSFGPGKHIDAGEAGMAVFASDEHWDRAVVATQHRVRTLATDLPESPVHLSSRIHPMAAVLALHGLTRVDQQLAARHTAVREWLTIHTDAVLVGGDPRRHHALWRVPVRGAARHLAGPLATELARGGASQFPAAHEALNEIRLANVGAAQPRRERFT